MSLALPYPFANPFSASSTQLSKDFHPTLQPCSQHEKIRGSKVKENGSGTCFASGLPTPPERKAMSAVSLNHHNSKYDTAQSYHSSRVNYNDRSAAREVLAGVHEQNLEGGNQNNSSKRNQSQLWPASQEKEKAHASKDSSNSASAIASYLQIPSSINDSKGSLAEFTAEITCLFWFESASTLQRAEELAFLNGSAVKMLAADALPTMGFLKWVTTILTTTQVTQNVILLALLFVHRLKKFNPGVSGKKGSEYRLLTIALMLGNKFLDDNTYTNKTWAEVSGISVSEIHIMEMEFLSNMRYNLYVSEDEWKRWHVKLARFSSYFNRASKAPQSEAVKRTSPITPVTRAFSYQLPSPHSPTRHAVPIPMYPPSLPNPMAMAPYLPHSPARYCYDGDGTVGGRKRSLEDVAELPSAKRLMTITPSSQPPPTVSPASQRVETQNLNSLSVTSADSVDNLLPVPKLPMLHFSTSSGQGVRSHPALAPLSVPPVRAMSTVYAHGLNNWSQPVTPGGTQPSSMNLYANPIPALGEVTRSQYGSANASPTTAGYGNGTPRQLSPSYILTNRNSPYRPVRSVSTLLIPPPSGPLHNPSRNIGLDQMRYQPLAKVPTEVRVGVVPYLHHDAWPPSWSGSTGMPSHYAFHA